MVGRPDEKYGEEVVAFVQLREGAMAGPADLIEFGRTSPVRGEVPARGPPRRRDPADQRMKTDRKLLRAMVASDQAEGDEPPGPLAEEPPTLP